MFYDPPPLLYYSFVPLRRHLSPHILHIVHIPRFHRLGGRTAEEPTKFIFSLKVTDVASQKNVAMGKTWALSNMISEGKKPPPAFYRRIHRSRESQRADIPRAKPPTTLVIVLKQSGKCKQNI